jgi:hypothetical protein
MFTLSEPIFGELYNIFMSCCDLKNLRFTLDTILKMKGSSQYVFPKICYLDIYIYKKLLCIIHAWKFFLTIEKLCIFSRIYGSCSIME